MTAMSRAALKGKFNTGDQPTETDFGDVIDSVPNTVDDGTTGTGSYVRGTSPTLDKPILTEDTPASASATGTKGMIAFDASYVYVCVATDTWVRAALSTW